MHVVCANYSFDPELTDPHALLDRYETLVNWADAVKSAGARVSVVQRFGSDAKVHRNGVCYHFVRDPTWRMGSLVDRARRLDEAVAATEPDVIHINGLQFARQAWLLKRMLERQRRVPMVLQDHKCAPPRRWINRLTLAPALRRLDAVSFAALDLAEPWQEGGFLSPEQTILEIMEGSCRFSLKAQAAARERTGLSGDPLCVSLSHLEPHKDPLTVLHGFAKALPTLPNARLAMLYGTTTLLPQIQKWLAKDGTAADRVTLLGQRAHEEIEDILNSADFFLSGSHCESSGYATIEAMACGAVPVVTNIPSFRVLTGEGTIGALWPIGDAEALAQALRTRYATISPRRREEVRAFFDKRFHWQAIGRATVAAYENLLAQMRDA